jgi:TM2 domain-containing membrane protein YozV
LSAFYPNYSQVVAPHVYIPVYLIASFFLFITGLVHLILKQNIHGWTVFSFVLSMFCMYIFLATCHLIGVFQLFEQEAEIEPLSILPASPHIICQAIGNKKMK